MLSVLIALATVGPVNSALICPPGRDQGLNKLLTRANVVGPPDRKLAKDFAKDNGTTAAEIQKRYAASGDIVCGDFIAQGQVVLKNDLVVTTAHTLLGPDCGKMFSPKDCRLVLDVGGKKKFYPFAKLESSGFWCPSRNPVKGPNDWMVLRLKTPVDASVKPYKIGAPPCANGGKPLDVVNVAKSEDWGSRDGDFTISNARHYSNCQVHDLNCRENGEDFDARSIYSDCDISMGSSGGGLFVGGAEPELIAVDQSRVQGCPEDKKNMTGPYNRKCWGAGSVAITGSFREELERVAAKSK